MEIIIVPIIIFISVILISFILAIISVIIDVTLDGIIPGRKEAATAADVTAYLAKANAAFYAEAALASTSPLLLPQPLPGPL